MNTDFKGVLVILVRLGTYKRQTKARMVDGETTAYLIHIRHITVIVLHN